MLMCRDIVVCTLSLTLVSAALLAETLGSCARLHVETLEQDPGHVENCDAGDPHESVDEFAPSAAHADTY